MLGDGRFSGAAVCRRDEHEAFTSTHRQDMDRAISSASQSFIPPADPAAPLPIGEELMTVNDAARFLRVTVSWVYEHTRDDAEDRLPFVKIGKYVRFDRTDLREFIDAKRQAARSASRRR
jgi:excisionase family DNA binding protein